MCGRRRRKSDLYLAHPWARHAGRSVSLTMPEVVSATGAPLRTIPGAGRPACASLRRHSVELDMRFNACRKRSVGAVADTIPGAGYPARHSATAPALPYLGHPCPRHAGRSVSLTMPEVVSATGASLRTIPGAGYPACASLRRHSVELDMRINACRKRSVGAVADTIPGAGYPARHSATAPALPYLGHPCPRHAGRSVSLTMPEGIVKATHFTQPHCWDLFFSCSQVISGAK